jgi:cysteine desulfurase/selenocysteine lyase
MDMKKDFPIFERRKELVYLDSAATSQKPRRVINALKKFYEEDNANPHSGVYALSYDAGKKYEDARKTIAGFINADSEEIIFTRNTTESINLLSHTLHEVMDKERKEIVVSEMEHHSNLIPWQEFAKRNGMTLKWIPLKDDLMLDYEKAREIINRQTAILAVTHASNVLGSVNDVKKLIGMCKENGALSVIDAAQSAPHIKIDVRDMDCDFLAFSGHKIFGPNIGVLFGKKELLEKLPPFLVGGGMIKRVDMKDASWADGISRFEAGTQSVGEVIAFAEAIRYVDGIGFDNIERHEKELLRYALERLRGINGIKLYNPGIENSVAVLSFNLKGIHPHDVASILDEHGVAIRVGHHCAMPLMRRLNVPGICRASFSIYNEKEDIEKLANGLTRVLEVFR